MTKKTGHRSDTDHQPGWRGTLVVLFLAQFCSGVAFTMILPLLPFYFRELGVTEQESNLMWNGAASFVFGLTMTISAPLWGMLSDKYGRKMMVIRSMAAGTIILGLMGLASDPWHLLILRMLQGATTGTVTASVALASSISPAGNRGTSLGLMQAALMLGAATGPIVGGLLTEQYGFRPACYLASALLFAGLVLVISMAREQFTRPAEPHHHGMLAVRGILNTPGFKVLLSVYFLVYVLNYTLYPILPLYIEQINDTGLGAESLTGIIVGVTLFIAGISAFWYGRLGDRIGHTRVLVICLVTSALLVLPQAAANSVATLFIERCLFGLAIGGLIPAVNALVSDIVPPERIGSAYGLTSGVTCFGIGMGPFIGGIVASFTGLRTPFVLMGGLALLLAVYTHIMFHGFPMRKQSRNTHL
jgi:MFS transporter, DHA1 family, multidrug resistance protein